jgi:protein-disulfide isomerase
MSGSKSPSTSGQRRREERRERAIQRDREKRRRLLLITGVTAVVVVALLIVIGQLARRDNGAPAIDYAGVPTEGLVVGDVDAPVTLVEYGDYQCIHCANFATDIEPELMADFIRDGKLKFEFRPMPILGGDDLNSPENRSVRAAEAAYCAADEGAFWPYHDRLMAATADNAQLDDDRLADVARDVGLDPDRFDTCMDERTHLQDVLAARTAGDEAGITSTPVFFLNDEPIAWTGDYDLLRSQIELTFEQETASSGRVDTPVAGLPARSRNE